MTLLQLEVPLLALSLTKATVTVPHPPEVVTAPGVGVGTALKHWALVFAGQVIVRPHGPGFSAIKMAAHGLLLETVADPAPVPGAPAAGFIAHPAATSAVVGLTSPYISLRAPGDVAVASEVIVLPSKPAANNTTAALVETVVIEVTPVTFPLAPVV